MGFHLVSFGDEAAAIFELSGHAIIDGWMDGWSDTNVSHFNKAV